MSRNHFFEHRVIKKQSFGGFSTRGVAIRLFLTCWIIYTLHFATNTVREIYPALSLGDHLSFDVTEYLGLHPDIFELPGRGVFINNNPGASILGAIPYALARPAIQVVVARVQAVRQAANTPPPDYQSIYPMAREFYRRAYEQGLDVKFGLAAGIMQALLMAPLSALSVVVMFWILLGLTGSTRKAVWLALLYAFATPVFYRTAQLNHNLLQSHFALFSFALLWRSWNDQQHPLPPRFFLAGLLAGWTFVLDYSGIVIILSIGLYALLRWTALPKKERSWSGLFLFAGGVVLSVGVLIAYQWRAFGNPLLPAQHYMPQTTYSGFGYQGIDWPKVDLLWELTFGIRYGLFISAPFLILALYPPGWYQRKLRLVNGREAAFILFFSIAFFLFTAANQFSRMQFNSGIRHLVPVTPFLFLIAAGVFLRLPSWIAAVFGLFATYWSWSLAMYRDVEQGLGIFESLIHITAEGPRLPWLNTLEYLGYAPANLALPVLLVSGGIVGLIWLVRLERVKEFLSVRSRNQKDPYSV